MKFNGKKWPHFWSDKVNVLSRFVILNIQKFKAIKILLIILKFHYIFLNK